jgi:hypothetical protein
MVWVTCPSARPIEDVLKWAAAWKAKGYQVAVWRDNARDSFALQAPGGCDLVMFHNDPYPGYAIAVNKLVKQIMLMHADAEWFIPYGDDGYPDAAHTAEEIAKECRDHFSGFYDDIRMPRKAAPVGAPSPDTFGAMQPTGDRWGENPNHPNPAMHGAYIDRVCGSAWLGREFCKSVNQGNGPLWPEYKHMFVDEELQAVAVKLGILWQRRDLIHFHAHAGRVPNYTEEMIPAHLRKWSGAEHWKEAKAIYLRRQAAGFPGSECL